MLRVQYICDDNRKGSHESGVAAKVSIADFAVKDAFVRLRVLEEGRLRLVQLIAKLKINQSENQSENQI